MQKIQKSRLANVALLNHEYKLPEQFLTGITVDTVEYIQLIFWFILKNRGYLQKFSWPFNGFPKMDLYKKNFKVANPMKKKNF